MVFFLCRNVLTTYEYESIIDHTPSISHMLLITGTDKKQSKVILSTNQVRFGHTNFLISTGGPGFKSRQEWI
jgi:hypothetical protein